MRHRQHLGRLLKRFPGAVSTGVDLDPALLTIAGGYFAGDGRVGFVAADLRDPQWPSKLPYETYDAVLTATALHWLQPEPLKALYGQIAGVLRDGGVFMNADHMPDPSTPRLNAAALAQDRARQEREKAAGGAPGEARGRVLTWEEWWATAKADPVLAEPTARRYEICGSHSDGESHSAEWHAGALREAGFEEARPVWRAVTDAVVLGLK